MVSEFYSGRKYSVGSIPSTQYLLGLWGGTAAEHLWAVVAKFLRGNLTGSWDSS